jgi:hypothetical protein
MQGGVFQMTNKVLPVMQNGGFWVTLPKLLFEKKGLICKVQQLIYSRLNN